MTITDAITSSTSGKASQNRKNSNNPKDLVCFVHESSGLPIESILNYRWKAGLKTSVGFIGMEKANQFVRDESRDIADFDCVLPDSFVVANLLKGLGAKRVNAIPQKRELQNILSFANDAGLSIYIFGGIPGAAPHLSKKISGEYPNIQILGERSNYFDRSTSQAIVTEINRVDPDIIVLGLGQDKTDRWANCYKEYLEARFIVSADKAFDFLIPKRRSSNSIAERYRFEKMRLTKSFYRSTKAMAELFGSFTWSSLRVISQDILRRIGMKISDSTKRLVDIAVSSAALFILLPVLILVGVSIRLESAGPALFRQTRVGKGGEEFTMLKFRSMSCDAESRRNEIGDDNHHGTNSVTFKISNDPRITPFGRFIRKYSIDELPQLVNVLRGDMSLVGPRPALPSEVARYSKSHKERLGGKPGITCTWQISGRADIAFEQQAQMDIDYIRTRSFIGDLMIILKTPLAVVTARGAY